MDSNVECPGTHMPAEQITLQLPSSRSRLFYIIGLYLNPGGFSFAIEHHAGLQRYSATVELRNQRKLFWGYQYRELRSMYYQILMLVNKRLQSMSNAGPQSAAMSERFNCLFYCLNSLSLFFFLI